MVSDPSSILPKLMVFTSPPLFSQAAIQNDFTSFPGQPSSTVRIGISTKVKPNADLPKAWRVISSCPQSPQPPIYSCHSMWPCLFLPEKHMLSRRLLSFSKEQVIPSRAMYVTPKTLSFSASLLVFKLSFKIGFLSYENAQNSFSLKNIQTKNPGISLSVPHSPLETTSFFPLDES